MVINRYEYDGDFDGYKWSRYYINSDEWNMDDVFKDEYFKAFRRTIYNTISSYDIDEYLDQLDIYFWAQDYKCQIGREYNNGYINKKMYILCDDYLEKLLHGLNVLIDL